MENLLVATFNSSKEKHFGVPSMTSKRSPSSFLRLFHMTAQTNIVIREKPAAVQLATIITIFSLGGYLVSLQMLKTDLMNHLQTKLASALITTGSDQHLYPNHSEKSLPGKSSSLDKTACNHILNSLKQPVLKRNCD